MFRCLKLPLDLLNSCRGHFTQRVLVVQMRFRLLVTVRSGSGLMVPFLSFHANAVHVLDYHYLPPDGKKLTDDERIAIRRPLKIYDDDKILDSSRKCKV